MTETPPPPPGTPGGTPEGSTPPPPPNPYGSAPTPPPAAPQNPYASAPPPPPAEPYAGNPPVAGQTPYGATPFPTTPGGPAPIVGGAQPGGLGPRFLARFIDFIILGIISAILTTIAGNVIGYALGGIISLGYFGYLESSQGRTFGKQILKLRVLNATGGKPTMEEALKRNIWVGLSIFSGIVVLNFVTGLAQLAAAIAIAVTINSDPLKRGWHDKFGNTNVIKEG